MENNENLVAMEDEALEAIDITVEDSGIGTGLAMIIGGVMTAAVYVGGKKLLGMWRKRKTEKEIVCESVGDSDVVEIDDEDVVSEE